jgi:hypothetical protein
MKFLIAVFAFITSATASAGKLTDVVQDQGHPLKLPFAEAANYCHAHGMSIPTARQIVDYAAGMGAQGARETKLRGVDQLDHAVHYEIQQNYQDGYTPIYNRDSASTIGVDFYYNLNGFGKFSSVPQVTCVWTSSKYDDHYDDGKSYQLNYTMCANKLWTDFRNLDRGFSQFFRCYSNN